jgi:hypothetical protein
MDATKGPLWELCIFTPYKETDTHNGAMHPDVRERIVSLGTWNRALLQKITVAQLVKIFLSF